MTPRRDAGDRLRGELEEQRISVPDGSIVCRRKRGSGRPIFFVAGWGAELSSFDGLWRGLDGDPDITFLETREKQSSNLVPSARFSMSRFASDVGSALSSLGLSSQPFVLAGTCFGAAICMEALTRGFVSPSLTVLFDPMPRMWVPEWILGYVAPALSIGFLNAVRPAVRRLLLRGMRERAQRARAQEIIDTADLWKWKRASIALKAWSAFRVASRVKAPVHVYNGSGDRFHHADVYPRIADMISDAAFLQFEVTEDRREEWMGEVVSAYATGVDSALPALLLRDERLIPELSTVPEHLQPVEEAV